MARASATDYLHSMRFFARTTGHGGYNPFANPAEAGFSTCTTPEASMDAVEYREGHFIYTRKQPGLPTMADITLTRGVVLVDTAFYDWVFQTIEGGPEYRVDLTIEHFHRDAMPGFQLGQNANQSGIKPGTTPQRKYVVAEAFPIRCKIAGDLDATASDISVSEIDVSYESFSISTDLG